MAESRNRNAVALVSFVVISSTTAGYFTGLQAPMPSSGILSASVSEDRLDKKPLAENVIVATRYADMPAATRGRQAVWQTKLSDFKPTADPLAKVEISAADKAFALQRRSGNRAFNGAPPTIPHAIHQTSAAACMVCHGEGARTETLRIPRMSHQFLANCTQCHVESNPGHMPASLFRESSFTGLAAPTGGPRAFAAAPPQIPHSTWMRSDCTSCHGLAGSHGLRTTHPWRRSCTQCHAPSSKLDQTLLAAEPQFLPPPTVE